MIAAALLAGLLSARASAASVNAGDVEFTPYGFLRASYVGATSAVESFGQPNLSAYSAAAPPTAPAPDSARGSFQYTQSRVGAIITKEGGPSGRVEFDFVDFTKASPTTKAVPRVRRAAIDWKPADTWLLRFGQDWDLVSPLAPHTYNPVGHYFESGDIGFMRVQAMAIKSAGKYEHAIALGLPAANNRATDSGIETGVSPSLALREGVALSPAWLVGASAIGSSMRPDTGGGRFFAGTGTAFVEYGKGGPLNVRSEAYYALNSFDLGLQGLGTRGDGGHNAEEVGGFLTARFKLGKDDALFGGGGWARVLNPITQPAAAVRGTGLLWNLTARLGWEHVLTPGFNFWLEGAELSTRHRLTGGSSASRRAEVFEAGVQFNFGPV